MSFELPGRNFYHVVFVDEDEEPSRRVVDDVLQSLEDRRRPMPDFVENSPENDDVGETVAFLQNVDFVQDDVRILFRF